MIQFHRKHSLANGNKLTKKNWHKVIAKKSEPCTTVHGFAEIDRQIKANGAYYEQWKLVYENERPENTGFIFREINHNGGINGHHQTAKLAVWWAMSNRVHVYLEE